MATLKRKRKRKTSEKENLKCVFWASDLGYPNQYTGFPKDLNTSLEI